MKMSNMKEICFLEYCFSVLADRWVRRQKGGWTDRWIDRGTCACVCA